jgi:hypothetical protein
MALVEVPECDLCGQKKHVTKWLSVFFEESDQLTLDFVNKAAEITEATTVHYLCRKHLKRYRHFVDRGSVMPTPRKRRKRKAEGVAAPTAGETDAC